MEFTKKMALVPESLLENLQTPKPQILQPPSVRKVSELDVEIRRILEDPEMDDSEKVEKYGQRLREFIFHKNRAIEPPTVYVKQQGLSAGLTTKQSVINNKDPNGEVPQAEPSRVIEDPPLKADILATVPKSMKTKADLLIEKLYQTPNVTWDSKGAVTIEGQPIPGSNIMDLVNDLLRKRKYFNPIGWQVLGRALSNNNLPQDLIGNADRYHYINNPSLTGTPTRKQRSRSHSAGHTTQRNRWDGHIGSHAYINDTPKVSRDLESTTLRRKTRRRQTSPDWLPYRNK
ncbi:hypothetical protein SNE40_012917 [Patella caerulea]|uniref:Uncharacterized protein n=1 Tax=Patella caerulea TaxID=87958 RepID=A0AAN8JL65_PATCE